MAFRCTYAAPEIAESEIALWRAKGEFWGIGSPFALRGGGDAPKVEDLAQENQPAQGGGGAPWAFHRPKPCSTIGIALSGPEIALPERFRPLPSPIERRPIRLAFLESHCNAGSRRVRAISARFVPIPKLSKLAGEAGSSWGCRVGGSRSDPGGRRPRAGGAKPQEAVLSFSLRAGPAGAELSTGRATLKLTVCVLIQRFFWIQDSGCLKPAEDLKK
jgi:hypothetical protein